MSRKGFTLVELILSAVIISIALTGTISVLNRVVFSSVDPMLQQQAITIANSYLEEIMTKRFPGVLPCPAPSGPRSEYSSICDYDGLVNNGVINQFGSSVSGLDSYTINVSVNTTSGFAGLIAGVDVVRVDVTVSNPNIVNTTLSSYRANF